MGVGERDFMVTQHKFHEGRLQLCVQHNFVYMKILINKHGPLNIKGERIKTSF